jgi:hypothetical protein
MTPRQHAHHALMTGFQCIPHAARFREGGFCGTLT